MNSGLIWSPPPQAAEGKDEIRVRLIAWKFREYRNLQLVTASMGLFITAIMGIALLSVFWQMIADPLHRAIWAAPLFFSGTLFVSIGMGTWPVLQLARKLSGILARDLPALLINSSGIWDNASDDPKGLLPWHEIEQVVISSRHAPSLKKYFRGVKLVLNSPNHREVFIPQGRIGTPVEELVNLINQFRARVTP